MAKVKKATAVTGVRNVKATRKATRQSAGTGAATKKAAKKVVGTGKVARKKASNRKSATGKVAKGTRGNSKSATRVKSFSKASAKTRRVPPAPMVRVVVKPLEPQAKCGAGTSVQYLFRVDETVDGRTTAHLVFFDRHGWYCEHGRNCPAVGHAKKHQGHMARAS